MCKAYEKMVNTLPMLFKGDNRPKLVIAIDEAQTLFLNEGQGYQLPTVLCKVISTYSGSSLMSHAVWVVFVSTTSKVANFAMASQKLRMPYFHQFRSPFILIETDRQFRAGSSNGRVVVSTVHISWLGSECIPL